ncbi:pirin family protein [Microbulbifer sp. SAOS-129_SWC]|uniref:pirin family protein n=1 Tax=Microbulbifer sp. SAOS-129_SWC TaxID=3145235 RepID=UPI00321659F0
MSNLHQIAEHECQLQPGCGALELVIHPQEKDLGGFSVRRCLPNAARRAVGPWIFFDHMGPAQFAAGQGIDVRPHPHINIATVSYLFEGEILHRDSLGSEQLVRPGDINLMVAGSGIVHSERERRAVRDAAHRVHGLQLWLALPQEFAEMDPEFHHYPAETIPSVTVDGVAARVIMGSAFGVTSPVKTFAETLYVEMHLQAGQSVTLPAAPERAVYVASGALRARDMQIPATAMGVFSAQEGVVVEATQESRIAIIGGASVGETRIDWNFASASDARIESAIRDWKSGRFAQVPGDSEEFIPYPAGAESAAEEK